MRILWITNMVMPKLADFLAIETGSSGTWMIDISEKLSQKSDIRLAIACVYGKSYRKIELNNITYYLLPGNGKNMLFYTKKYEKVWKIINDDFKPDIVHIHGTEYSHGLSYLRSCPNINSIISIQGVLNRIKNVDFADIPIVEYIKNRTIKQNFHLNGEIEMHWIHKKNAKYEKEMLLRAKYANVVTTWDESICRSLNPNIKTFRIEYNLRDDMYHSLKWSAKNIERHTIFTNPGGTPLKGLHMLLMAVSLLKCKYPDIKVLVPGMGVNGKLVINSAYSKYIYKLIKRYHLEHNVNFLGKQTGKQMCENMLKSHITVIPSAIEGTSLILREAMFLGCPCICSFRGGMADFIQDKHDGFLYDFQEYPYLAKRIDELFANDELCNKFSQNAILKAEIAHDRKKNIDDYMNMYRKVKEEGDNC